MLLHHLLLIKYNNMIDRFYYIIASTIDEFNQSVFLLCVSFFITFTASFYIYESKELYKYIIYMRRILFRKCTLLLRGGEICPSFAPFSFSLQLVR